MQTRLAAADLLPPPLPKRQFCDYERYVIPPRL
jgi:hypothetical protein